MESCQICNRIFNTNKLLKRHVVEVHSGTKFNCICGKGFSRKNRLMNHENICSVFITSNNLKEDNSGETLSIDSKIKSLNDIVKNNSELYDKLSDSNESHDGNVVDNDGIISKPHVKRYPSQKPKMSNDSTDEEDDVVHRPRRRLIRLSAKSQSGSGSDSNQSRINYNGKSDIFSKRNSIETDSYESSSQVSDIFSKRNSIKTDSDESSSQVSDKSDSEEKCYCRDCNTSKIKKNKYIHSRKRKFNNQSERDDSDENSSDESDIDKKNYYQDCNSSKNFKNKYIHSRKRKFNNQSEGQNDFEGGNSDGETEIFEDSNPYSKYYTSQASGGGVCKTIIGNSNQAGDIEGRFSYLHNTRFSTGGIGNGFIKPVSSYLY